MTKKQHCGPFTLAIDDQAETVTITLKRCNTKAGQLMPEGLQSVASWALAVAEGTGYEVDTTQCPEFFTS